MPDTPFPAIVQGLEPGVRQRQRMARAVYAGVEAEQATLLGEWIALLRARPLLHGAYALAAAALIVWMSPLAALPLRLLGG